MKRTFHLAASGRNSRVARLAAVVLALASAATAVHAQTTYTYYSGTSNAYLSASHWTVGGSASTKFPGVDNNASSTADGATSDIAAFGAIGFTAANGLGINFNTSANTGVTNNSGANGALSLGAFDFLSGLGSSFQIGNSSTTLAGVLTLNGDTLNNVAGTIISNESSKSVTFAPQSTGTATTTPMTISLGTTASAIQINGSGNIVVTTAINQVTAGSALSVTGTGGGAVTLSGVNTFSGGLVAAGAEVDVSADNNLGAAGGNITINGGRLGFATNTFTVDPNRGVFLGANPTGGNNTGTLSIKGSITTTFNQGFQNLTGSTGDLVKQGGGTLALGGQSSYTGSTFLNNGFTKLTTGDDRLPTGTTVYLGQTASANVGTLDLGGFNQRIAGLNSTNATTGAPASKNTVTSATAATLTLGGGGTYAYGDGTVGNSGVLTGALAVNKTGTGTQTFGDANTYTGDTAVKGGTLLLTNTTGSGTGTGNVVVSNVGSVLGGGTATGMGGFSGTVTVNSGGKIAPGTTGAPVAVLSTGALTLNSGSTHAMDITGAAAAGTTTAAGATYDQVNVTGTVTVGGTLALTVAGYTPTASSNDEYFIVNNDGTDAVAGTYSSVTGLPSGYGIDYNADFSTGALSGGNDIAIVPIPEPASVFAGLLMLGALSWSQRRRLTGMLGRAGVA